MSVATTCLPPSSSLPPARRLWATSKEGISAALHNLQTIYCPLRLPPVLLKTKQEAAYVTPVDSGYASEDDDEVDTEDIVARLRSDEFERNCAVRWLTGLISRVDELPFSEDERAHIIDEASFILASFTDSTDNDEDTTLTRTFSFPTSLSTEPVTVNLNDAPLSGTDHTDVGLQSWGASIVFASLMCATPSDYGLDVLPQDARVIELGAGTGLLSLALAKLAPSLLARRLSITATDYHPAVLSNLESNIAMNFPLDPSSSAPAPVRTSLLDWSTPPPSLQGSADLLLAADVVYAPEHALWLRTCAAHLLKPTGEFWLVVTVRSHGKFEGIPETAEAAFADESALPIREGRVLRVMERRAVEKRTGVGRGDECGYVLFRVGWV